MPPGLARAAEVLPVRVTENTDVLPEPAVLARGIDAAVAAGATVLLVAGAVRDDPALQVATQAALNAGIPVVAGGDGDDVGLSFPAAYDGVIAVAAIGQQDDARPVNAAGRVTVGAPGVDLVGFGRAGDFVAGSADRPMRPRWWPGTVADVRASYPELSPFDLRQRLIATADRPGVAVPDPGLGWGVINPVTALTAPIGDADRAGGRTDPSSVAAPAVVVDLPPPAADNDWAVGVAVFVLVLAGGIAAVVAGVRRAGRRRWRPATEQAQAGGPSQEVDGPIVTGELGDFGTPRDSTGLGRDRSSH